MAKWLLLVNGEIMVFQRFTTLPCFQFFVRTAENPLYRIEKRPKLRNKQGEYAVIGMDGQILKRGQDLKKVIRILERKLIRAVV